MFKRLFGIVIIFWLSAVYAFAGDPYTVSGVHVDATAKNAIEAQTLAISDGQTRAANMIINRMSLASERAQKGFSGVDRQDGAKMIRALEISNEKRSANRYLGDITIAFNPNAISQYMRANGLTLISTQSRNRLVIPILQGASLWDGNEWVEAWQDGQFSNALTPIQALTPRAGLEGLITNMSGDNNISLQNLQAIGAIFGVQQILLATASAGVDGYSVMLKDIALDSGLARTFGPVRGVGAPEATQAAMHIIEEDWKASAVSSVSAKSVTMDVSILYRSQSEWQQLQDIINGSAQIRSAQLRALSKRGALMSLTYGGDIERLRNELSFKGVKIEQDEKLGVVLYRTGAF